MSQLRCVLLDRDGTINVERCYLSSPDQLELLPYAVQGLRRMKQLGLKLAVVTNQSGLACGYFDVDRLDVIHERLCTMLRAEGVELDGIFYCPHHPEVRCSCRKPATGLAHQVASRLGLQVDECCVIGDKPCDIDFGTAVGATTFLVRTGYGREMEAQGATNPSHVVDDLNHAADVIEQLMNTAADGRASGRQRRPAGARRRRAG